ncbi:unnamed protein product [Rotaria sp. Silwood1]|nr:unnamed protein product [Rotaria sp. Silwood1]CAF3578205.1 unnamed protein product [Rotaria sp. Silwood1]CAF4897019.1 unnamed protein product [Rotaria sp. Silwood1]
MYRLILTYINIILFIYLLLVGSIDSRRTLRNYIVYNQYLSQFRQNQFSVYDQSEKNLLCRIESSSEYSFNRLNNLILYPFNQTIASINNLWSPYMYQAHINILDVKLNKWMSGQIYQSYSSQGFQFRIEYRRKYYIMENKVDSLITEIRDEKRSNYILTRFYQISNDIIFSSSSSSSKYKIQVYTNDLPHPLYMLALYAFDSIRLNRRIIFIP